MDHRLAIVEAELKEQSDKVSKYILTTSVGTKYAWTYSSEFHPSWKEKCFEEGFERIKEGYTILLDWIKNREGTPASIVWNCYGYALLNIQLKNINISINSLEDDHNEKWVIDKNCPFMDDVLLKLFTKVRLRFDKGSLNKSSIEKDIFEKIGEHIDLNDAIWEICGSTIWKVENKKNNYSIKLIHNKSYSMNYINKDNIIVD